jgi:hypothetical protein
MGMNVSIGSWSGRSGQIMSSAGNEHPDQHRKAADEPCRARPLRLADEDNDQRPDDLPDRREDRDERPWAEELRDWRPL